MVNKGLKETLLQKKGNKLHYLTYMCKAFVIAIMKALPYMFYFKSHQF